jgi:hypothetical protein
MAAAGPVPPEKRSVFLERVAGTLRRHGGRFSDGDAARAYPSSRQHDFLLIVT